MKNIILYSGGLESFCTLAKLLQKNCVDHIVYFDFGLPYQIPEMKNIRSTLSYLQNERRFDVLDRLFMSHISDIGDLMVDEKNVFIPYRNLFLMLLTIRHFPEDITIYIGHNRDDRVHDNSIKFIESVNLLFKNTALHKVEVKSLWSNMTKNEMVREVIDTTNFTPKEICDLTYSCFSPDEHGDECLACKACMRKNVVMNAFGVFRPFYNREIIQETIDNLNGYTTIRKEDTCRYLRRFSLSSLTNKEDSTNGND